MVGHGFMSFCSNTLFHNEIKLVLEVLEECLRQFSPQQMHSKLSLGCPQEVQVPDFAPWLMHGQPPARACASMPLAATPASWVCVSSWEPWVRILCTCSSHSFTMSVCPLLRSLRARCCTPGVHGMHGMHGAGWALQWRACAVMQAAIQSLSLFYSGPEIWGCTGL